MSNIYNEVQRDRFLNSAAFDEDDDVINDISSVEFPEQLILTINSYTNPYMGEVISSIRKHIIDCNSKGIIPEIILMICITDVNTVEDDRLYGAYFITLAEYIDNISESTSIKLSIMVRGIFTESMYPLVFIDENNKDACIVKVSKYTKIYHANLNNNLYITDKCNKFKIDIANYNNPNPNDNVNYANSTFLIKNQLIVQ